MYDTSGHTSSQPDETAQQDTRTLPNNDEGWIEELIVQALATTTSDTTYFQNYRDLYDHLTSILREVKDTKILPSKQTIDNIHMTTYYMTLRKIANLDGRGNKVELTQKERLSVMPTLGSRNYTKWNPAS